MTNTQNTQTKITTKVIIKLTQQQIDHLNTLTTTSSKVRYLSSEGFSTNENKYSGISNYLNIRTQHVRNILTQPLKK